MKRMEYDLQDALTCSACKVNKKDAILTKCRHIFCQACLQKRYDTRFVKCELTALVDDLKTWILLNGSVPFF